MQEKNNAYKKEFANLKEEKKNLELQVKRQKYKMGQDCKTLANKITENYTSVWTHNAAQLFRLGWRERGLDPSKQTFTNGPSDFDAKYKVKNLLPTPDAPDIDLDALGIETTYCDPDRDNEAHPE